MDKKDYFGIFKSYGLYTEKELNDVRESLAVCNEVQANEVSEEMVADYVNDSLDDERENLDIETGGVIIAYANLGRWNGRFIGGKIYGTNIKSILNTSCDDVEWYADKYNVRGSLHHHDGTDYVLYRYVDTREKAERLLDKFSRSEITDEQQFRKATKSIRPFIARTYGWKEYGRLPY